MATSPASPTSREGLLGSLAPFNQIRNALYQLIRFMQEKNVNVPEDLRRMGRDIARTFSKYWLPPMDNPAHALREVYQFVTGSKVKVETAGRILRVVDKKCRLCNMKYADIEHAGCEVIAAMVTEFFAQAHVKGATTVNLVLLGVDKSRARGDNQCVHVYQVE